MQKGPKVRDSDEYAAHSSPRTGKAGSDSPPGVWSPVLVVSQALQKLQDKIAMVLGPVWEYTPCEDLIRAGKQLKPC